MMFQSTILALFVLQASARVSQPEEHRRLSFERLVGYQPTTQITDHAAIDLDQQIMEQMMNAGNLIAGRNVYEQGGHSYSFAEIRLINSPSEASWPAGTQVFGLTEDGQEVSGSLLLPVQWTPPATGQTYQVNLDVLYKTSDIQEAYVDCQVGGLYTFNKANRNGCFAPNGTIAFLPVGQFDASQATIYEYFYDIRQQNFNGRFLKRFSIEANKSMRPCPECAYFPDFQKFFNFYGNFDYADRWITAAFYSEQTNFENGRGNADFAGYNKDALTEAISKGTAYMSVLMYVIRELEDAVYSCKLGCGAQTCDDGEAVHSLDEAVAFYAGSLEGRDGSGDGVLVYNLADKRSLDFRTCGEKGDEPSGTSYVNIQIVQEFQRAQLFLLEKDCASTEVIKNNIVNYMKVPLIQGILRYAYIREYLTPEQEAIAQMAEAEGATFAAALLPWLHACDSVDADIVYDIMRIGSADKQVDGFKHVKKALERNYKCMGITCGDVGGLWTPDGYAPYASPCGNGASGAAAGSEDNNVGIIIGSIIGVSLGLCLLFFAMWSACSSKQTGSSKSSGNIAAVSEIS